MTCQSRLCPICNTRSMVQAHEDELGRAYECQNCLAVEKITKDTTGWWYHGTQALDIEGEPGERIDGDGIRAKAPVPFRVWIASAGPAEAFSR